MQSPPREAAGAAVLKFDDSGVRAVGNWTAEHLSEVEQALATGPWPEGAIRFDLEGLQEIDTIGAWLLQRTLFDLQAKGRSVRIEGAQPRTERLLELIAAYRTEVDAVPARSSPSVLAHIGHEAREHLRQYYGLLEFVGETTRISGQLLLHPARIRGSRILRELHAAGVMALSIVGLLSFLIGVVIAYQGGIVLQDYGANIYVADIVGLSMVRELAPLITAIIVAGRTGSAYTAEIGTMIVTEEVDALRSLGIVPIEILVLPKILALIIALPLLTVYSDVIGILGGLVMSSAMLDLHPATYLNRLEEALTLKSYLSGIGKAPVFAVVIAIVGCYQGFRVFGSAESVGRQTTISVVQSIFLVILLDGLFSVAFSKLGI